MDGIGWGPIEMECLECGRDDLRLRPGLGERVRPVFVCRGCDAEFETLPLQQ